MYSPHEMEPKNSINEIAANLALRYPISGSFGGYTQIDYYAFTTFERYDAPWENYSGKKMLDIGTGVSDFVARLLAKGADASALDYRYGDKDALLVEASANAFFKNSFQQYPERYIAGVAHQLPFKSNSLDAVTSMETIFGVTDHDLDLLRLNVEEGIRVLKPGGILRLGPFQQGDLSNLQKASQAHIVESLKNREDVLVFAKQPRFMRSRLADEIGLLTIQKAT